MTEQRGEDGHYLTVVIDVVNADAVTLGEHLRERTFVGEEYGCYGTFDVRPDAVQTAGNLARSFFGDDDEYLRDQDFFGYRYDAEDLTVECYWYWDGDGSLAFRVLDGDTVLRVIENTDCKKWDRWEDVDDPFHDIDSTVYFGRHSAS